MNGPTTTTAPTLAPTSASASGPVPSSAAGDPSAKPVLYYTAEEDEAILRMGLQLKSKEFPTWESICVVSVIHARLHF